jgi:carboxypeptidase Taq
MDILAAYKDHLREIGKLGSALSLLHWDQRTQLPNSGQETRAEVVGKLTKMVFELSIADKLGRYLEELEKREDLSEEESASVRVVGKAYRRNKAIPPDFYERFAIAASKAETTWEKAKERSDFLLFRPHLEEMVEYARQFAEYYGYKESPYDALIEEYEPGMTSRELRAVIEPLRQELVPFIKRLQKEGTPPETDFLRGTFSKTRFLVDDPLSGLFSSLHEGGHALYDQGIAPKLRWTGLDEGASYGIHESQSRMWENLVGRSRPFWTFFQPTFASTFPAFSGIPAETLYRAANVVKPSLIRVEADEVTYNLHIMLRFELEEGLITGKISAGDLPDLWRDAMDRYLGVVPEEDADGVLQDVHWSSGLFGYFPSYMLGNLYSSQIFACVQKEIPDLDTHFARGDFAPLLTWLRERVHRFGMIYEPKDLVKRITGEDSDASYFVRYIEEKYSQIYKL